MSSPILILILIIQYLLTRDRDAMRNVHYSRISRTLRRMKNKVFPRSPTNIDELEAEFAKPHIMKAFGMTGEDESETFFYGTVTGKHSSCAVFGSPEIIELIKENIPPAERVYLLDATFKIVPMGFFKQLLIIYIAYRGAIFPFLYILMSNKHVQAYKDVFGYIHANIFDLDPAKFITDFEKALRIALLYLYADVKMIACWFHYTQALRRFAAKIPNFFRKASLDPELDRMFHKFLILALLPAINIAPMFYSMKNWIESKENPEFDQFTAYFERQWIKNVSTNNII